jgi:mono/diheme cytochrome c family protein
LIAHALAFEQVRANRTFDAATVNRGKALFTQNCAFCHGADARGGDGGTDLARSIVVFSDENGAGIENLVKDGRAEKGMPAFPGLSKEQISDIATFLHDRVEAARNRIAGDDVPVVIGDPVAGKAYFTGKGGCSGCHSLTTDMKGIGAKYDPMTLQDKFVNPRGMGRGTEPPETRQQTVTVTSSSGERFAGQLLYISEFGVTLRDSQGQRRSFLRHGDEPNIEVHDPLKAHLDLLLKYTDKDIHDLTAFLVTLK